MQESTWTRAAELLVAVARIVAYQHWGLGSCFMVFLEYKLGLGFST